MGTTAEKLQRVLDSKNALKTSINNKGGNITDSTPFSQYATAIDNLPSGASNGEPLVVEELPTENINEKAIYQLNDTIKDLVIVDSNNRNMLMSYNYYNKISFVQCKTRPVENIVESTLENIVAYYIEDENDVFMYFNMGSGANFYPASALFYAIEGSQYTFKGLIYDRAEAKEIGYYVLLYKNTDYLYNQEYRELMTLEQAINFLANLETVETKKMKNINLNIFYDIKPGFFTWSKFDKVTINFQSPVNNTISIDLFNYCEINTVIINSNLKNLNLNQGAFRQSKIKNLVLNADTFTVNETVFDYSSFSNGTGYIYVPDNVVDTVKAQSGFSDYASQIKPISEYVEE